jgi:hypothetical protein
MKKTIFPHILEFLAVIGFLGIFYLRDLQTVAFSIDESHWIGTSYMFEAYFKGEFWSDAWRESHTTLTNPPVPRYAIGLSRLIGGYDVPDLNRRWDYDHDVNYNLRRGAMPSDGLLWWSRLPMAVLAVFSLAMGFFFIKKTGGRFAAYVWVLFGATSPYLLLQLRRAMAESSILFFVMLAALACYLALQALRRPDRKAPWFAWLCLGFSGFCIGVAGESKINGLSVLLGMLACVLGFVLWKQTDAPVRKARRILGLSALVSGVTVLAFLGSNPYLWPDPVGRTLKVAQNRVDEMRLQTVWFPMSAINSLKQRLTLIPRRIFQDYAVLHFERAWVLNIALTALGAGLALVKIRDWFRGGVDDPMNFVLLTTALTASAPAFMTLLDWSRYYLFPVFFSTAFIAIALGWLGGCAVECVRDRLVKGREPPRYEAHEEIS